MNSNVKLNNGDPVIVSLADVEKQDVQWLWRSRIPQGKLTMLDGDPGNGKSWFSFAIAAALTNGQPLPDDGEIREPSNVLILSAEDGLGDTIRPRLEGMQADLTRIQVLTGIQGEKTEQHLNIADNLASLESALKQRPYSLVIIDPLNAYIGNGVDTHKDAAIRAVLTPLSQLAAKYNVALLCIRHLNKGSSDKAIYRGQGSIAYTAAARVGLLLGVHPDNKNQRIVACIKNNLTEKPPAIAFDITNSQFTWMGVSDVTEDMLLQTSKEYKERTTEKEEAMEFLQTLLADEPVSAKEVQTQGEEVGFSLRTLKRAKKELGATSKRIGKTGSEGSWAWMLPNATKETNDTEGEVLEPLEETVSNEELHQKENAKSANGLDLFEDDINQDDGTQDDYLF